VRHLRRLLTVPTYLAATAFATLSAPVLAPLCWLVSFHPKWHGALRSAAFLLTYLWCESVGIAVSFWLWIRRGFPTRSSARWSEFLDDNFVLQCAWASALERAAETLFALRFTLTGADALAGPPAIVLARHASIADTIIPMVFYAIPHRIRLRYVLKRELLLDPCLDIVGNRLPNCFVARSGADAGADIPRVEALARDRGANDGFLLYPEGTRFSPARRERVLANLADRLPTDELARMQRWTDLLPPRPGGALALIEAAADLDLVFCAHTGFEGASHFRSLVNGSWIGADIRIHFWRVRRRDVPAGSDARRAFLLDQWDRMQESITALRAKQRRPVAA
jgi:1-acyl-sn-glycerol-3-phosphate acyltransferase